MDVVARMLEATVVTLREGIEASLVVALVIAYLRRARRGAQTVFVYWGLGAAVAASVAAAIVVQRLGVDPENELWEGTLMLVAAGLVGSLVLWMRRAGRRLRADIEARVAKVDAGGARAGLALFAFTFFMVFREGVETVLFLGALSGTIGGNALYNAVGGGTGLLLAALFGTLLVQGSVRIDLRRFFRVTEVVLLLLVAKLLANGLHEFFEGGLLPSTERVLSVVGLLTRETTSLLVLVLLLALPAALLLEQAWRASVPTAGSDETAAEHRRRRAEFRAARVWTAAAGLAGLALSGLLVLASVATARGFDPKPVALPLPVGELRLPLAELSNEPLKKYTVTLDGVPVRFFVLRRAAGDFAVAFDACAICPIKGYHLAGDQMVCGNCGAPIAADTVGVAGGCNPIPLKARIDSDQLVIRAEDLAAGRARFAHGA